jgi:hypothetical protein
MMPVDVSGIWSITAAQYTAGGWVTKILQKRESNDGASN